MKKLQLKPELERSIIETLDNIAHLLPENHADCLDPHPEPIPYKAYDGFIPYTNGGFTFTALSDLSLAMGGGSYHPVIGEYIESAQKDAMTVFLEEKGASVEGLDFTELGDKIDNLPEKEKESFYNFEHEYLSEGAFFAYQVKVLYYAADNHRNISGTDEIYIIAGVNTDFEYIRDKGLQLTYEKTIKVMELSPGLLKDVIEAAAISTQG